MTAADVMTKVLQEHKKALTANEISNYAKEKYGDESPSYNSITMAQNNNPTLFYSTSGYGKRIGLIEFLHVVVKKAIITHFFGKTRFRPNISVSIDEFKQTILKLLEEIDSKEDTVCDRASSVEVE